MKGPWIGPQPVPVPSAAMEPVDAVVEVEQVVRGKLDRAAHPKPHITGHAMGSDPHAVHKLGLDVEHPLRLPLVADWGKAGNDKSCPHTR